MSNHSYTSAMSQQEENLVNLHTQVDKPITESPLLMSSYLSHLTQLRCSNLNTAIPIFDSESRDEKMESKGGFFPTFDVIEEGFSCINMVDRQDEPYAPVHSFSAGSTNSKSGVDAAAGEEGEGGKVDLCETALMDNNTSKATIIVKFMGSVDIVLCPMVLESIQRVFEALTPTFQALHPVSVINHLHSAALDRVEAKNTLKKEKSLDLQEKLIDTREKQLKTGSKSSSKKTKEFATTEIIGTFEKSISSYVQASLNLPKVNLMILQASVVEDMCAFSALDNVRDITCVSLLALSLKETTFQLCKTSQSKKTIQVYLQRQRAVSGKKRGGIKKQKLNSSDAHRQNEPFVLESSETQKEELLMTGSLHKAHAQLRRLKNDSSILKDAYITAIPHHKSKVFFEYVDVPKLSSFRTSTPVDDDDSVRLSGGGGGGGGYSHQAGGGSARGADSAANEDSKLGFNMCECGFEGVSVKIARRSSNQEEEEHRDVSSQHLQSTALSQAKNETVHLNVVDEVGGGGGGSNHGVNKPATTAAAQSSLASTGYQHFVPRRGEEAAGARRQKFYTNPSGGAAPAASASGGSLTEDNDYLRDEGDPTSGAGTSAADALSNSSSTIGGKHSTASGSIEFKSSWFNFAAPPKTPIGRKIDFTKLDWNLLSTARLGDLIAFIPVSFFC